MREKLKLLGLAMGISSTILMINVFYSIGIKREEVRIALENQIFNIFEMFLAIISLIGLIIITKEEIKREVDKRWKNANTRD